jgi:hypothetical protein
MGVVNAQTPPTMVENVDEPARNPFQQTLYCTNENPQACVLEYTKVPAGKTLRLTNVSCFAAFEDGGTIYNFFVRSAENSIMTAYLPSNVSQPNGYPQGNTVYVNGAINLYSNAGNKPTILFNITNSGILDGSACTLSGYYVTL